MQIQCHWHPPRPTLPAYARGTPAEALCSAADNRTRRHWCDARDRLSSGQRYDSMQAFLLAARKCDFPSGGNCAKEWACKKMQHCTTIDKIPPTMTKQMGMQNNQQLNTAINLHRACLFRGRTEWRKKNLFRMADGGAERNGMVFS